MLYLGSLVRTLVKQIIYNAFDVIVFSSDNKTFGHYPIIKYLWELQHKQGLWLANIPNAKQCECKVLWSAFSNKKTINH